MCYFCKAVLRFSHQFKEVNIKQKIHIQRLINWRIKPNIQKGFGFIPQTFNKMRFINKLDPIKTIYKIDIYFLYIKVNK